MHVPLLVVIGGVIFTAYAVWGVMLKLGPKARESYADRESWYESGLGKFGGPPSS